MSDARLSPHGGTARPRSGFPGADWIAVALLAALLAAIYTGLGLWRYAIFRAGVDDGIFTQVVSGAFHRFASTSEYGLNHLLVHFSPILVLAYPFVRFAHGASGLIVLQAMLIAATVLPVYGIARARLPIPAALVVALVAAIYPPLSGQAIGDFHELAFAPLLSASLVWALDARRWKITCAIALVLACVKEDVLVGLAFVGVAIVVTSRHDPPRRRCGWVIAAIGVATFTAYFTVVRPLINPSAPYWSLHFYQWTAFGPTPNGFVALNSPLRLRYLLDALAPLVFIPLFSRFALFAIPGFLEVMASHEGITYVIGAHYGSAWSGYLLAALADGAATLCRRSLALMWYALAAALFMSYRFNVYDSPVQPGYFLDARPNRHDARLERFLRSLPRDATLYSAQSLFAHLGDDPKASVTFNCQRYGVFDARADAAGWQHVYRPLIRRLTEHRTYRVAVRRDGTVLLVRVAAQCPKPP